MALALNNLKRVDMPLNKETKPNYNDQGDCRVQLFLFLLMNVKFLLVEQHRCVYVQEYIEEHRLRVRLYFSTAYLTGVGCEMGSKWP